MSSNEAEPSDAANALRSSLILYVSLMKNLYPEICKRFPEVRSEFFDDEDDLPYCLLHRLVDWLATLERKEITEKLIERVTAFCKWCNDQPRGSTAEDDIYTAWHVAFLEKLFRHSTTRMFLPYIIPKEAIVDARDYLIKWAGNENYEAALKEYK
jgi:hypothetical protein